MFGHKNYTMMPQRSTSKTCDDKKIDFSVNLYVIFHSLSLYTSWSDLPVVLKNYMKLKFLSEMHNAMLRLKRNTNMDTCY